MYIFDMVYATKSLTCNEKLTMDVSLV